MTSRRAAIQAGVCGGLGLSLGDMFRLQSQGGEAFSMTQGQTLKDPKALSVIQLHLGGGFPQHESFDPKPESPVEYRGAFGIQKTNTGEIFSDNFPNTAAVADKLTVIRSMVGKIPDHAVATYHLFTGYTPTAVIDFPQMGSIISHELGKRGDLPPYVAIPNNHSFAGGTGFLSSTHGPFELNADPAERNYKVKDFSIPERVSMERFDRRKTAREIIEQKIRGLEADPTMLDTMDDFYQQAYTLLTSKQSQAAFALDGETEETFELYGRDVVGLKGPDNKFHPKGLAEKMIVARRLVESGVRFVTVNYGAWDSHVDVKNDCLDQMPALDHAIAGLITDLDRRGLLDTTIFWVTSEFGRTPKINNTSGRDHWARNYSMLVAGGGFAPGLVYGASDSIGGEPARDAVPLENLMHTIYHQLGIDAGKELLAFGTRPIEIIKDGKLVKGLLS
ncbi:Protein of unknown function [Neorhodopirellula lusitana]|uniref:DUF1501 domain-containing protein n=1 Tax=Neorhodopirellula lusitana TaxID=445327 RepID=A0ABY1QKW0_9BACT|nr:DUF1501 domain-containing protein [Neorhodopirellula lusitana]SMP72326.1 Protein of unknown function [Neorhodopirellula lusitana]